MIIVDQKRGPKTKKNCKKYNFFDLISSNFGKKSYEKSDNANRIMRYKNGKYRIYPVPLSKVRKKGFFRIRRYASIRYLR